MYFFTSAETGCQVERKFLAPRCKWKQLLFFLCTFLRQGQLIILKKPLKMFSSPYYCTVMTCSVSKKGHIHLQFGAPAGTDRKTLMCLQVVEIRDAYHLILAKSKIYTDTSFLLNIRCNNSEKFLESLPRHCYAVPNVFL